MLHYQVLVNLFYVSCKISRECVLQESVYYKCILEESVYYESYFRKVQYCLNKVRELSDN